MLSRSSMQRDADFRDPGMPSECCRSYVVACAQPTMCTPHCIMHPCEPVHNELLGCSPPPFPSLCSFPVPPPPNMQPNFCGLFSAVIIIPMIWSDQSVKQRIWFLDSLCSQSGLSFHLLHKDRSKYTPCLQQHIADFVDLLHAVGIF